MRRLGPIALLCAAATTVAGTAAASLTGPGLWTAASALAPDDPANAAARGDLVAGFLTALSVGFVVDDATSAWLQDLRDGILELDLHRTWSRLPDVQGDVHKVHVVGRNETTGGYTLRLGAVAPSPRRHLGDVDGYAGLVPSPWQGATAFASEGDLALATHPVGHPEVRAIAGALLHALEDAAAGTSGPQTDAALRARVHTDFPATAATLDRVLTFESWGRRLSDGVLLVDIKARIDPARLAEAGYPALSKFVRRMSDVADLSLTVRSRHGDLGTIWAKSPGTYGLRFATRDGALVPTSGDTPQPDRALDVAHISAADLALRPRGIIRLKGTRLSVDHWTVPLRYRVTGDTASLTADIRTLPSVDFRADGGVGGWMVATAGNAVGLEPQALRFFQSVADGPDGPGGSGSVVSLSMQPHGGHWTMDGRWDVRMLDNLVVRFAAQVLGQRIVPDDAVLDELLALESDLVGALASDWQRARPVVVAGR